MGKQAAAQIVLSAIIHQTPNALRYGGDGWLVTFAGTEADKEEAAKLILFKNTPLKLTIELYGNPTEKQEQADSTKEPSNGRRPWLERKARAKADA